MNFSIITPSFRNNKWLPLCIASVADQEGVTLEHIVQDSCSDDGTQEWLPQDKRVKAFIEKDQGMYDAVNRGFKRSQGDYLAYLNCDEQYLPGGLKAVHEEFVAHPDLDVVLSGTVIVDVDGNYICHRPSLVPLKNHMWVRFAVLTCAVFVRRRVIDDYGIYFDTKWRDLGDMFWLMELAKRGARMRTISNFTSVFTETGDNMNLKPNALREKAEKFQMTPAWVKRLTPAIVMYHRLRMLASGAYTQKSFDYSLYTLTSTKQRVMRHISKPTGLWKGRY